MTLSFPNPSRSFDAGGGGPVGEHQALAAFDAARQSVHQVARDAYANTKQTTYFLTARDFR